MKLSEFKVDLESVGLSFDLIKQHKNQFPLDEQESLDATVAHAPHSAAALNSMFRFSDTPEGIDFWWNKKCELLALLNKRTNYEQN